MAITISAHPWPDISIELDSGLQLCTVQLHQVGVCTQNTIMLTLCTPCTVVGRSGEPLVQCSIFKMLSCLYLLLDCWASAVCMYGVCIGCVQWQCYGFSFVFTLPANAMYGRCGPSHVACSDREGSFYWAAWHMLYFAAVLLGVTSSV